MMNSRGDSWQLSGSAARNRAASACPDCGNSAGGAGCLTMFEEVIAREFGDFRYGRRHRLTVDAYALQHPEPYLDSAKSFAAHLTGMCLALEFEDPAALNQAVRRWLDGPRDLTKPARLPVRPAALNVSHVHRASSAEEHLARVGEWAASVWREWTDFQPLAREWIAAATHRA